MITSNNVVLNGSNLPVWFSSLTRVPPKKTCIHSQGCPTQSTLIATFYQFFSRYIVLSQWSLKSFRSRPNERLPPSEFCCRHRGGAETEGGEDGGGEGGTGRGGGGGGRELRHQPHHRHPGRPTPSSLTQTKPCRTILPHRPCQETTQTQTKNAMRNPGFHTRLAGEDQSANLKPDPRLRLSAKTVRTHRGRCAASNEVRTIPARAAGQTDRRAGPGGL